MESQPLSQALRNIYQQLMAHYGPQHWWPARESFEVIIGAILTQSAAWRNVEKAIANLRAADVLSPKALRRLSISELATLIRPCGYYNAKALKLKAFADWLEKHYQDDLNRLFARNIDPLRQQLLAIYGIGEETADSIILYAAGKPSFVIDAYTRRILNRIGLYPDSNRYLSYQTFFTDNLPDDSRLFTNITPCSSAWRRMSAASHRFVHHAASITGASPIPRLPENFHPGPYFNILGVQNRMTLTDTPPLDAD